MKIQLVSDLHLEHWHPWHLRILEKVSRGVDVLVVEGDLLSVSLFTDAETDEVWKALSDKAKHVLYIPGNHELYGSRVPRALELLAKMFERGPGNVHHLDSSTVTIDGVRFVGCSLWFPNQPDNSRYQRYLNDFNLIEGFVPWVYDTNEHDVDFLRSTVQPKDVVITHHLPSQLSVHRRYKSSPLNRFFVCPMDDLIVERRPVLWLHGHTHSSCDYVLGETHVVCNPMGYPGEAITFKETIISLD